MSNTTEKLNVHTQDRFHRPGASPHQPTLDAKAADEIKRYFQQKAPVMLDGALPKSGDKHNFIRHARESLAKTPGHADLLPTAILRETLDAVANTPRRKYDPATKAGLTPVGPKTGRVWWDKSVVDNLEDILARLDKPKAVLRFYDVTGLDPESGRWHDSFDIDVQLAEQGHTVNFWAADRAYVVDLGYVHADGRFLKLARTNAARLPRDCAGPEDNGETAKTLLHTKQRQTSPEIAPDEAAAAWTSARPDFETRDLETELVVHMIYRSFLREGPRALRRSPRLFRRDPDILRREFAARQHERERKRAQWIPAQKPRPGAFLVARLDAETERRSTNTRSELPPAAVGVTPLEAARTALGFTVDGEPVEAASRLAWFQTLFAAHRMVVKTGTLPVVRSLPVDVDIDEHQPVVQVEAENEETEETSDLVTTVIGRARSASYMSSKSVFEAAQGLRDSLVELSAFDEESEEPDDDESQTADEERTQRVFGGSEAKRMAKAGVRITRMALTLEGRMRPGARLKVAGKLVRADADGNFRLECVLSGRRASIPMRAAPSIGGEARSLINIDWEKRAPREKKKVW